MSIDPIKALKVQRANAKRALTKYLTFLENYNPGKDFATLEKRHKEMFTVREAFENSQNEIEVMETETEEGDVNSEEERNQFEDKYFEAYGIAKRLLQAGVARPNASEQATVATTVSAAATIESHPVSSTLSSSTLPAIDLPQFSGSYASWLGFRDLFKSIVHEDARIPPIQKLFYLRRCLKGEAQGLIDSIALTPENYVEAWDLLNKRYNNRKVIKRKHINAILDLPAISKEFSTRHFLDNLQKHLRSLKSLGVSVEYWDAILVAIIIRKLDRLLRDKWEDFTTEIENPSVMIMIDFLQQRAHREEADSEQYATSSAAIREKRVPVLRNAPRPQQALVASNKKLGCAMCKGDHMIHACKQFLDLTPSERFQAAKRLALCLNCLKGNHRLNQCSSGHCKKCKQKHNTLLHRDEISTSREVANTSSKNRQETEDAAQGTSINLYSTASSEALLATALVELVTSQGKTKNCRVFLDAGSESHFITEEVAKFLKLGRRSVDISVSGLGGVSTTVIHEVSVRMRSRFNKFEKEIDCLVVPCITNTTPSITVSPSSLAIPRNIILADPDFHKPAKIDLLIGVKLFYKLLCVGQIALQSQPGAILQKTQLGWIIAGEISNHPAAGKFPKQCHLNMQTCSLDATVRKFWEIEEIPSSKFLSPEEQACEEHFVANTYRETNGRYVVRLPFNEKKSQLGDSYHLAHKRFLLLERRLAREPVLKQEYHRFLKEYEDLRHMFVARQGKVANGFYLPHHAVSKEDSLTTKIRVVFDASAKSASGVSLNDTLMVGPKIQDDLVEILIRFRSYSFALTADIEKMYRQIKVDPQDSTFQRILFRASAEEPIREYVLDTVTYGTSCASFLAIRVLHQLVKDEGHNFPLASGKAAKDFYVDDLLTGAQSREEAEHLRDELVALMKKGGFNLRKWASNDPTLLQNQDENPNCTHMSLDLSTNIKALGILWNAQEDYIFYAVNLKESKQQNSKRSMLSQIAMLFDPLGLLGPVIVRAKILIQRLWKAGVSWDESVPQEIHTEWTEYKEQLPLVRNVHFPRAVVTPDAASMQLHGFSDASEKAYGACIYARVVNVNGDTESRLICSKSRVAPVKPLTLPRLELSAALLLSRLVAMVKQAWTIPTDDTYLWSDSKVTLQWIDLQPHTAKTFIANRVAEIQSLTSGCHWRHVPSQENPADLISRGQTPQEFGSAHLWHNGPDWLLRAESHWPRNLVLSGDIPELRAPLNKICMKIETSQGNLLEKYSSSRKLKHVIAYMQRFLHNAKQKEERRSGPLRNCEINAAERTIIKIVQSADFANEIRALRRNESLDDRSTLIPLAPFLDEHGILRVGGRLHHSKLPEGQRHPILLPSKHYITKLIIREEHQRLGHAGAQTTLYAVRERFWPLNARNVTRKIIFGCVPCFRVKPRIVNHSMGSLPQERVSQCRPFTFVGVDFCGPLYIKEKRFRNRNRVKVYVAVYTCMATKAIHLELVSDLTTEAFIGSLKRLFSRRGKAKAMYSDNATNFIGARREISEIYKLLSLNESVGKLRHYFESEKIDWHFIPPRAPHFGGLWEAAVKSFKSHLVRVVGNTLLTYDQLETCILEIEAILNSRPISPMSSDPNDPRPLTPGHFLIGSALTSFPQVDLRDTPSNRLSAWQHAQQIKQHFWTRWHKEYLHQLCTRTKWPKGSENLEVGALVLLKEDNLPPLQWAVGRVFSVHPGEDGVVRVATVKTTHGTYKRCVRKLCPMPLE